MTRAGSEAPSRHGAKDRLDPVARRGAERRALAPGLGRGTPGSRHELAIGSTNPWRHGALAAPLEHAIPVHAVAKETP